MSGDLHQAEIKTAMRKVADWQTARIADTPSQDWTFATLYVGMLSASDTLGMPLYRNTVRHVAEHFDWRLGPRRTHADDQAIGQSYLWLYRLKPDAKDIAAIHAQFDEVMVRPDDLAKPVWWWCDALFMAPPVWAGLAAVTHDQRYLDYMDHEWQVTNSLLWDRMSGCFTGTTAISISARRMGAKCSGLGATGG